MFIDKPNKTHFNGDVQIKSDCPTGRAGLNLFVRQLPRFVAPCLIFF